MRNTNTRLCGNSTTVIQNVNKAQVKVRAKKDNVAGVTLPVFEHYQEGGDSKSNNIWMKYAFSPALPNQVHIPCL